MRRRLGVILTLAVTLCVFSACRQAPTGDPQPRAEAAETGTGPPATSLSRAQSSPPVPASRAQANERLPCKTIGVDGHATLSDDHADDASVTSLGIASTVPNGAWVVLEATTKITTKDPRTGRELTFEGPGRVSPCKPWDDEAWVDRGRFGSVPGTGEGPGSEEWVVTSLGVLRYGAAVVTVTAEGLSRVEIRVATGSASLWALDITTEEAGARDEDGWRRLDAGARITLIGNDDVLRKRAANGSVSPARDAAGDAAGQCSSAAATAHELADRIALPGAALSDLAPRHISARRAARAACGVARLRAESLPAKGSRQALLARIATADRAWRGLGSRMDP